ncbi:MAG: hypothetical protein KIT80_16085 [Chitinophagaceae bacterium]|nr:hypothetical protein [Chitinophagaceae bacterium]MCW5928436.1 hypothetical protein [Chitinophagaceae bacterium]
MVPNLHLRFVIGYLSDQLTEDTRMLIVFIADVEKDLLAIIQLIPFDNAFVKLALGFFSLLTTVDQESNVLDHFFVTPIMFLQAPFFLKSLFFFEPLHFDLQLCSSFFGEIV